MNNVTEITKTISVSRPRQNRIDYLLNGRVVCTVEKSMMFGEEQITVRWSSLGEVTPAEAADFALIVSSASQVQFDWGQF